MVYFWFISFRWIFIKIFIHIAQQQTNNYFAFKSECNIDEKLVAVTYRVAELYKVLGYHVGSRNKFSYLFNESRRSKLTLRENRIYTLIHSFYKKEIIYAYTDILKLVEIASALQQRRKSKCDYFGIWITTSSPSIYQFAASPVAWTLMQISHVT